MLFDAIEFNDRFTCIDVLYDLAFLLMDLDRHGLRERACQLLNRYLERTHDYGGLAAIPLFLSCRAAIRAHVTAAAARISTSGSPSSRLHEAEGFLDQAIDYLAKPEHPRVVVVSGLSGTGKSTLARMLAPHLGMTPGAVILRSDVIRKQMFGVDDDTILPPSAYSDEVTAQVYRHIADVSVAIVEAGYTVIADAVYGRESERVQIEAAAHSRQVPFSALWLVAEQSTLEARIAARRNDPSDATVDVVRRQRAVIQPPLSWTPINAAGSKTDVLDRILAVIHSMVG